MKLTELNGKENLPEKAVMSCSWPNIPDAKKKGFNDAIDQYNQLEIDGEVGELANIITSEYYPCDERATLLARQIISNLSKFLVVKKGG